MEPYFRFYIKFSKENHIDFVKGLLTLRNLIYLFYPSGREGKFDTFDERPPHLGPCLGRSNSSKRRPRESEGVP